MIHHTTELIAEEFDRLGFRYHISEHGEDSVEVSEVEIALNIMQGPTVVVHFINADEDNDTTMRVLSIINRISDDYRAAMLEACNTANLRDPFFKYFLDDVGDLSVTYDFPRTIDDDAVGQTATEMLMYLNVSLDSYFPIFVKALYGGERKSTATDVLREIRELIRTPIQVNDASEERSGPGG